MADIIVASILIAIVCVILYKMRKDKKAGKHSCGGNCAGCALSCDQRKEG